MQDQSERTMEHTNINYKPPHGTMHVHFFENFYNSSEHIQKHSKHIQNHSNHTQEQSNSDSRLFQNTLKF